MAPKRFEVGTFDRWMFLILVTVLVSMILAALPLVLRMKAGVSPEDRTKAYDQSRRRR